MLQVIYLSLKNTLKALEGVAHINKTLESIYSDITYGKVPSTWLSYCYPTFESLPLFLTNLSDRISFFKGWIDCGHPKNFWLPGFFDQKSFFTTMLQQKARKDDMYFTTLALNLTPLPQDADIPDPPRPKDQDDEEEDNEQANNMHDEESASDFSVGSAVKSGSNKLSQIVEEKELSHSEKSGGQGSDQNDSDDEAKKEELYLHGLFIEGAQWDYEKACISDAKLRVLNYIMPAFKLQVITKDQYEQLYHNDQYFMCPLFKISLRESLNLDGDCFIMHVPLKVNPGTTPKLWLKRSTALFCQMNI